MIGSLTKAFKKVFGDKYQRDLKEVMPLVELANAEFAKLAPLSNNELRQRGVLFWDEPEANLNPQLSVIVARVLQRLASEGIQVFVATHDYLVAESLGLLAAEADAPPMRFFSFTRAPGHEAVEVEGASDLDDLERNLIREEFLRHYDRVRGAG